MIKFNIVLATAVLMMSGQAFAAALQPAAGEAPFANQPVLTASTLQRAAVQADAARQLPAAGEMSARGAPMQAGGVTRAQVRAATREAIAHGFRVASGESV